MVQEQQNVKNNVGTGTNLAVVVGRVDAHLENVEQRVDQVRRARSDTEGRAGADEPAP